MTDKRFDVIYTQGMPANIEILRDKETGVNYLHTADKLTPLLDKDGKPIRTVTKEFQFDGNAENSANDGHAILSKYGDEEFDNAKPDGTEIGSAEIGSAEFDNIQSQFAFVNKPEPLTTTVAKNAQPTAPSGKMQGFGIAFGSFLASICSFIVLCFYNWSAFLLFPIVFVVALILGIKSIRIFRKCGRENLPRPVSTLVFGIIGLVNCYISVLGWLICMLSYNSL